MTLKFWATGNIKLTLKSDLQLLELKYINYLKQVKIYYWRTITEVNNFPENSDILVSNEEKKKKINNQ